MPTVLVIVLGLYTVLDSLSLGLGAEQRPAYAAVFCIVVALLLLSKRRLTIPSNLTLAKRCWWAVGIIGLVMITMQDNIYGLYVVGDSASFFFPAILLSLAHRDPTPFCHSRSLKLLGAIMIAAALGSVLAIPTLFHSVERFREPPLLLMALCWLGIARPKNLAELATSIILSVVILQLTWMSGARFSLILWPMMGLILFAFGHVTKQVVAIATCALVLSIATVNFFVESTNLVEQLEGSRIGVLVERLTVGNIMAEIADDSSMNNRILEAQDALYTRYDYQNALQWIFGAGHGATFEGTTAQYGDRLLPNGDVHHIHFGVVLVYYRYGVPGFIGFVWLLAAACKQVWTLRRLPSSSPLYFPALLFALAGLAYLLNMLLFNALVDPLFAFTIVGFLTTRALSMQMVSKRLARPRVNQAPTKQAHVSMPTPASLVLNSIRRSC